MDVFGDSLFVGLLASVILGGLLTISDDFAESIRWRSGVWAIFWGTITAVLYFPAFLVDRGILAAPFAMGIPELRAQIAQWIGMNWATSAGFVLGMIALTLAFSGQEHDELLAIKKACNYLSPILFVIGFLLPVVQFFANLL
ncbi:MAG: hypothetical protein ACLP5V_16150 [Candidatus Bathyarchaeia archaeon]